MIVDITVNLQISLKNYKQLNVLQFWGSFPYDQTQFSKYNVPFVTDWPDYSRVFVVGSFVANIAELLRLPTNSERFQLLSQRLLLKGGMETRETEVRNTWFEMNPSSAEVILRTKIDRDELCGKMEVCVIQLKVFLSLTLRLH